MRNLNYCNMMIQHENVWKFILKHYHSKTTTTIYSPIWHITLTCILLRYNHAHAPVGSGAGGRSDDDLWPTCSSSSEHDVHMQILLESQKPVLLPSSWHRLMQDMRVRHSGTWLRQARHLPACPRPTTSALSRRGLFLHASRTAQSVGWRKTTGSKKLAFAKYYLTAKGMTVLGQQQLQWWSSWKPYGIATAKLLVSAVNLIDL